jgi:hypothetical protein
MEASDQRAKPAWMPSGLNADALRENLRGLKDLKLGDSPAEAAAALRQNLRGLKDSRPAGASAPGALASRDAAGATVPTPPFEERPELYVGAAFAGGLALAGLLRLLGR